MQIEGYHRREDQRQGVGRGPALFYGYCPQTQQMRMMDYPDYLNSIQDAYSRFSTPTIENISRTMQSMIGSLQARGPAAPGAQPREQDHHHHPHGHEHGHKCGCCRQCEPDCHCQCCICDADVVEYARCGETRIIPLTFENDSRRERDVKLTLGPFATSGGSEPGWQANLSETQFKLLGCAEKTVLLSVRVDCSKLTGVNDPAGNDNREGRIPSVDECKVLYATVRAEGCLIRPIVIAIAVRPNDCGAHHVCCQCGCCCD
jgi:hypothetical protein